MNLRKLIFVNNDCYKSGRIIVPKGIMVHSTGANNPNLKRYVGPDDGLLGYNQFGNHWNRPMDRQVCVHAFIGKLADGSIATYQTLPWNMRGWHCGSGPKGTGNDSHISFEICEDNIYGRITCGSQQIPLASSFARMIIFGDIFLLFYAVPHHNNSADDKRNPSYRIARNADNKRYNRSNY